MNKAIHSKWDNLRSKDGDTQYQAFCDLLEVTGKPVDWAYEVWDELVDRLRDKDNHQRAIAAQLLSNLATSDPENRMLRDFGALLQVTRDERFVTARHSMQAIWRVGIAGKRQQRLVVVGLTTRFKECISERNCTLTRFDIIQDFRKLYAATGDEKLREKALVLIETEQDTKFRKKYASVWRHV